MTTLMIDATSLISNPKGVGKYTQEMCRHLDKLLPNTWKIFLVIFSGNLPSFALSSRTQIILINKCSDIKCGLIVMPKLINELNSDIFLRLTDGVGWRSAVPTATVCHDINELIDNAQSCRYGSYGIFVKKIRNYFRIRALRLSTMVFFNSNFTRNEAISRYGINPEKAKLAYCGVDEGFYLGSKVDAVIRIKKYIGIDRFVLSFATGDIRENYKILHDICFYSKNIGLKTCFVIAGLDLNANYTNEIKRNLSIHSLKDGIDFILLPFLGSSDFELLRDLYRAADYYLELSLHEGFGMQLAEAMACGTTCISPNHSALAEVGGKYIIVIDNKDPCQIARKIKEAYDGGAHERDNTSQIQHTLHFSWEGTANNIIKGLVEISKTEI